MHDSDEMGVSSSGRGGGHSDTEELACFRNVWVIVVIIIICFWGSNRVRVRVIVVIIWVIVVIIIICFWGWNSEWTGHTRALVV